ADERLQDRGVLFVHVRFSPWKRRRTLDQRALTRPVIEVAAGSGVSWAASTRKRRRKGCPCAVPATKSSSPAPQGKASIFDSGAPPATIHTSAPRGLVTTCTVPGAPWPPTTLPGSAEGHPSRTPALARLFSS